MTKKPYIAFPDPANIKEKLPAAKCVICRGIQWDNTYTNVRLFSSREKLVNFLNKHAKYTYENMSPIRAGSFEIDVPNNEFKVMECNYMYFINEPYDSTPHFAFITGSVALNEHASRVTFEMDVWQESIFDIDFSKGVYVERMTVNPAEDTIGANTLPENVELGEYIHPSGKDIYELPELSVRGNTRVVFATAYDENGNVAQGGYIGGVYSAINYHVPEDFNSNPNAYMESIIKNNLQNGLISVFQMPSDFIDTETQWKVARIPKETTNIDGYVPRYKKMFTYPYCALVANNNNGIEHVYRYEDFSNDVCEFTYTVLLDVNPILYCYPTNYKGIKQAHQEAIEFTGYPMCAVAVDAYKAWVAQSGSYLLSDALSTIPIFKNVNTDKMASWISGGLSFLKGGGMTGNFLGGVSSAIQQQTDAYMQSPYTKGVQQKGIFRAADSDYISVYEICIKQEYARIIDDYWHIFGYPKHRIVTFNDKNSLNASGHDEWTYIKTINCTFTGNIEQEMLGKIRAIFDNGVTIWHKNSMNYTDSNWQEKDPED